MRITGMSSISGITDLIVWLRNGQTCWQSWSNASSQSVWLSATEVLRNIGGDSSDHDQNCMKVIQGMTRVMAVSRVGQQAAFTFLSPDMVYADSTIVFPLESFACFCSLQSRPHEIWARFLYDKPILDALGTPDVARANRDYLRDVYSVVKVADADIKFTFFTGVSKFSKVSLSSDLNNLADITLNPRYSSICGYTHDTHDDLLKVLEPELTGLDRQAVRDWYNGYGWLGEERLYNPFDILLLFFNREFRASWFETGTPSFLIDFAATGLDIVVEDSSSRGRVDMTVRFNGNVYVFEFKVVEPAGKGAAMAPLREKGYADKYAHLGEPIHLIGVEFSSERRNVVAFAAERAA